MAFRAIASLSISFGLVSIPVKVYAATEASAALRFKLLGRQGARLKQQFVVDEEPDADPSLGEPAPGGLGAADGPRGRVGARTNDSVAAAVARSAPSARGATQEQEPAPRGVVERSDLVKGYEFEKGKFVVFTPDELAALAEGSRPTIDIVSFVPERSVDPIYFDKPYFLAPDGRGARPYTLLLRAMQETGRCALAKWAWRSRQHVVQIRPGDGGLVLQQLRYADEVRGLDELGIELAEVGAAELGLAIRLIEQISEDAYDPHQFVDEEKLRIRAAIERKIAGRAVVAPPRERAGAEIVDLMEALRASLGAKDDGKPDRSAGPRKPARRAARRSTPGVARSGR